jgi:hypothetical protein
MLITLHVRTRINTNIKKTTNILNQTEKNNDILLFESCGKNKKEIISIFRSYFVANVFKKHDTITHSHSSD